MTMSKSSGWQLVPLGQVIASAQSGFASGARDPNGVIQMRMNNVTTDGSLDWTSFIRVPATPKQLAKYRLQPGDVLFNATNSPELVGKTTAFSGHAEPVVFSNHFVRLRVDGKRLDPWYLARWLTHQQQQRVFENLCTQWVNQASVRKDDLLSLRIPLPPLPEQKRIAAILAKADRLRRLRRTARDLNDTYLQSVFLEMFGDPVSNPMGWEMKKLGTLGEVQGGLQLSRKRDTLELKAPYLRVANVYRDELDLSEIKMIGLTPNEFERVKLQKGDLLIVEGHGNINEIGRSALWDGSIENCVHQNHLIRMRVFPEFAHSIYLSRYINSSGGRDYFKRASHTTSGLNTISTGTVKSCPVPLPPLPLQREFAHIVHKFERLRAQQREAQRQAEHLFQTLLHRAFREEL